ncbi:hypothetical protein Kisp01_32310 [Kineosporia sp. NBRC 101677]|nr:hypothetical protein [Kineosporia sp. NBRC 101677]GLY16216.1 hypothetical protein Kisp01_32310 [Kineosporia sp. NBRC 101677]
MSNSPRGFAGIRQRMTRSDAKHANPSPAEGGRPAVPAPTPTDSGEMPVPLRPADMRGGDHIDLRVSSESQEHRFAFEPGAPLPARSRRSSQPPTPQHGVPEAAEVVPPVTGAEAIIASATVISPVSGTYLVSAEPVEEARRQAAAAHAAAAATATHAPHTPRAQAGPVAPPPTSAAGAYRHEERRRVPRPQQASAPRPAEQPYGQQQPAHPGQGRPAPSAPYANPGYQGYDGTGYGTPPVGSPAVTPAAYQHPTVPPPAYQAPPVTPPAYQAPPVTPAAYQPPATPPAISPTTEPLNLRHLQGHPAPAVEPDSTMRRRTDQSADWFPARPAERQPESHLGSRSAGPVGSPARRPLGPGPGDRPGSALQLRSPKDAYMTNIDTVLKEAMQIDGAVGVALVDYTSGMTLGQAGGGSLNLEVAAAGNTEVVRAKLRTMEALGLREGIEDILITLDSQYHLIRLITDQTGIGLFLYLALDKHRSNLALARRKLANLERTIEI